MFVYILFSLAISTWTVRAASTGVRATDQLVKHDHDGHLFRRDYTFDPELGGWLKFHPMPLEWQDAALRCYYEGAILASPLNEELTNALNRIVVDRALTTTRIFTGLSNANSKAEYQSMEGVSIANIWLQWAANPEVDASKENCIIMNVVGSVSAVRCSDPHPFVCYREKPFAYPYKCGTEEPGYDYNQQTGSCYKIFSEEKINWNDAFQSCANDGGHLAVLNSDTEARILWELSRVYARDNTVVIGARAWGTRRAWITVQGQSLEEAGYAKWRRGEPNNANNNEYCVGIYAGDKIDLGVMNDVPCHDKFHYICEIEPMDEHHHEIHEKSEASNNITSSKLIEKLSN